ncbi:Gar1/Naf1 RNA binding region-domain-containing protein [Trametes meyenii]|nr:Gar1/Naf1 RNA binding region-domain-containing protein [Trametes meyenii]
MSRILPFIVPSAVPQDLQLIQDIIGDIKVPASSEPHSKNIGEDHDHGTDSDTDSEKEVEADILGDAEDEGGDLITGENMPPAESTSISDSSSDSDSDSEIEEGPDTAKTANKRMIVDVDDDEDGDAVVGTLDAHVRTKNEVADIDIMVPEISEVGPHEDLEEVGELISIVDRVVIIRGIPSGIANRGSEKALDCDTLLVFGDRTVLGYIFETFGPTNEPLYQIRFNQKYPLDTEKVQVGKKVYHVPERSNYVFVRQLRQFKGSDASNVHDEEPADDEIEFSDDEQEAAHKRALTQRREQSRARSVTASRQTTPLPSRMRDQDMLDDPYGGGPLEQSLSYNDMDFGAGPSRPAPTPYDDPYSDSYGAAPPSGDQADGSPASPSRSALASTNRPEQAPGRGRGRDGSSAGRGGAQRRDDSSRGRGRGRRQNDRGRGRGRGRGGGGGNDPRSASNGWRQGVSSNGYDSRGPRPLSPTSLAIARATGQYAEVSSQQDAYGQGQHTGDSGAVWGYPQGPMQSYDFSFGYQYPHVQPHINPRFASNFGIANMGIGYRYGAQSAPNGYNASGYNVDGGGVNGGWGDTEWNSHMQAQQDQSQSDMSHES